VCLPRSLTLRRVVEKTRFAGFILGLVIWCAVIGAWLFITGIAWLVGGWSLAMIVGIPLGLIFWATMKVPGRSAPPSARRSAPTTRRTRSRTNRHSLGPTEGGAGNLFEENRRALIELSDLRRGLQHLSDSELWWIGVEKFNAEEREAARELLKDIERITANMIDDLPRDRGYGLER
jgi:hypothetical protein